MSMAATFEARSSFAPDAGTAEEPGVERRGPESGFRTMIPEYATDDGDPRVSRIQDQFIDSWARMASAFAMDRMTGRVHALLYISHEPIDVAAIAYRLASTEDACRDHVELLDAWGLVRVAERDALGNPRYEAEQDPWSWFLRTIRERHRREFTPLQSGIRNVLVAAKTLRDASRDPAARVAHERIERFSRFVDEFARLIDAFVGMGAGTMATLLKTVAKLMPRASGL
jgi:DNA-binding transcriptional regulator GbsR (MarR family)